jgi:hypothetical protein
MPAPEEYRRVPAEHCAAVHFAIARLPPSRTPFPRTARRDSRLGHGFDILIHRHSPGFRPRLWKVACEQVHLRLVHQHGIGEIFETLPPGSFDGCSKQPMRELDPIRHPTPGSIPGQEELRGRKRVYQSAVRAFLFQKMFTHGGSFNVLYHTARPGETGRSGAN